MMLEHAMKAVRQGFTIFPVEPMGKTPCRLYPDRPKEEAPWTIKWSEVASNDPAQVTHWWTCIPNANIGIACKPSGLLVVDCDMPKREFQLKDTPYGYLHAEFGPHVDGTDVYRSMAGRLGADWYTLLASYRVCTGSMGLHVYYRWPGSLQASQSSIVNGILDIRCNGGDKGGYVLGAGSVTDKGPYVAENDLSILDAPPWLIELCREKPRAVASFRQPVAPGAIQQPGRQRSSGNYSGLEDQVRYAPEGNRSNVLLWASRAMYSDGALQEDAEEILIPAACTAGLTEHEARATVRSGYRLQAQKEG